MAESRAIRELCRNGESPICQNLAIIPEQEISKQVVFAVFSVLLLIGSRGIFILSETTFERTSNVAIEDQPREADVFGTEAIDNENLVEEQWGGEVTALVSANAEVMVRCPWMGDAVVALGTAMITYDYPPNMTAADEPFLISVVNELLANQEETQKEEEPEVEPTRFEDEKPPQEKKAVLAQEPHQETIVESDQPLVEPQTAKPTQAPEKTIDSPQGLTASTSTKEKLHEPIDAAVKLAEEVVANAANVESARPTRSPVVNKSDNHSLKSPVHIANTANPAVKKVPPTINSTHETQRAETVVDETKSGARWQPETLRTTKIGTAGQKSEPLARLLTTEKAGFTGQPVSATPDYQIDASGPIDFYEEEVLISHFEEVDTGMLEIIESHTDSEKNPVSQAGSELNVPRQEGADLEQPVQATMQAVSTASRVSEFIREDGQTILSDGGIVLATPSVEKMVDRSYGEPEGAGIVGEPSLMVEDIESSIVQLAARIKAGGSQTTEMANKNLDKIIETVAKLEAPGRDDNITEAEAQEELKELFTGFFNEMGIDHTPELISCLARHTSFWQLVDEIEKLKDDEEAEEVPPDSVTHVIIKKLIAALKAIKSATGHACAIGRAALALCNFQLKFDKI